MLFAINKNIYRTVTKLYPVLSRLLLNRFLFLSYLLGYPISELILWNQIKNKTIFLK